MNIEIRTDINPKDHFKSKYIIKYAFSIGERHFFKFDDSYNIPAERGLTSIVFFREVELNADRKFLMEHCDAVINALSPTEASPVIEAGEALIMVRQLKKRLGLPVDTDLMYKLASVVYFDPQENPDYYEYKYGQDKIKFWKENTTLEGFFLQKPLLELIPYLQHVEANLDTLDLLTKRANLVDSARIQENLSRKR